MQRGERTAAGCIFISENSRKTETKAEQDKKRRQVETTMGAEMAKKVADMTLEELWELFPIVLRPYAAQYLEWYAAEAAKLSGLLGGSIVRISHIGSTAVEGLAGKPTVDILLEVGAGADLDAIARMLQQVGWGLMAEQTQPYEAKSLAKGYTEQGFAEKVYHLHLRRSGDWPELYFRDYLRAYRDVALVYEALKYSLGEAYRHDRDAYTAGKTDFVTRYSRLARDCWPDKYKPLNASSGGKSESGGFGCE